MAKKRIDPQELYDTLSFYHVPFPDKKIDSFVYFISDGEYVKIGKGFPIQRMKGLQTGNPRELSLLFTIPVGEISIEERRNYNSPLFHRYDGVCYAEDMIHSFFRNSHLRGGVVRHPGPDRPGRVQAVLRRSVQQRKGRH